jgi:E3 ubiquitin-protein ligase MARCH6
LFFASKLHVLFQPLLQSHLLYFKTLTGISFLQVLASNAIFLIVVIFVPFSLGRIVLYYLSWFFSSASTPMLAKMMPFTETAISIANDTLKSALNVVKNFSSDSNNEGVIGHVIEVVTQSLKINATGLSVIQGTGKSSLMKGTTIGSSYLSDLTTLAVGYMFIFFLVFLYIGSLALLRYARGERFTIGRLYGIATILEAIPSLCRQFFAGMKHLMTMVKVAFLLVIELGVFPLMCGWWLDVCTLKMLGTTIAQRVEFFTMSPLASSSMHWLVGIVYMLQISIFVSLLRGVLLSHLIFRATALKTFKFSYVPLISLSFYLIVVGAAQWSSLFSAGPC